MQHLSRILLARLFLFFFPFFSLLSSIFLARISLIKSKNTWKDKADEKHPRCQTVSNNVDFFQDTKFFRSLFSCTNYCTLFPFIELYMVCSLFKPITVTLNLVGVPSQNTDLVHVGSGFSWGFHIAHTPLLSSTLGLVCAHLSPVLQVRFIPNQKEGYVLIFLHTQDLLSAQCRKCSAQMCHQSIIQCHCTALLYLKSAVAAKDSSSVMEKTQRKPSPLRK